ncbi:MAG: hypothetical protein EA402_03805, partial [Planctomycetota bacterium]
MAQQDPHAKQLLTGYPQDTVSLFAPDLIAAHGEVRHIEALSNEVFNLDPQARSGLLDIALKCTFADGTAHILLLIEHWSTAKSMDYRRTIRYWAELLWRHPDCLVVPIMLVTDPSLSDPSRLPETFTYAVADRPVASIHFRLHAITQAWRQRITGSRNVVEIVLWAVPNDGNPVDRCFEAMRHIVPARPQWPKGALATLLACVTAMAKLKNRQQRQLRQRLEEDPTM